MPAMKVMTVVGARPQFVKAAAVSRVLRQEHQEVLVHTGQHYDHGLSSVFFDELGIPAPDYSLGVGSGSHGAQTGEMLRALEGVVCAVRPDVVLVYGDTNSTLAAALAAVKVQVPVAHVEAGLRSFNRSMPEEINRIVTDHVSRLLICPSATAVRNLKEEGISKGVVLAGDVMAAALFSAAGQTGRRTTVLQDVGVKPGRYLLATVHRAENTEDVEKLASIVRALGAAEEDVVFPVHPRTAASLRRHKLDLVPYRNLRVIGPVGYLDMVCLTSNARLVLTDSGGLQKEAYWLSVPCVTLRAETEWVETVEAGWNVLVGADEASIGNAIRQFGPPSQHPLLYGDAASPAQVVAALEAEFSSIRA